MISSILLAIDGSAPSQRAMDMAASLALRFRSKITVLHAYTPTPINGGRHSYMPSACSTPDEAQALTDQVASQLRKIGVAEVETAVVEGPAVNVILGAAEDHQADMIVIGARGVSAWQGVPLGSVSMAVTQRAACPVLVVK